MRHFATASISLFLVLALFSACSATASKRSIGEVIDDAVITNKLKTSYMKDKGVKAHQIDVDTWKGVVSLRGRVESQDQINRAIELAERQPGVREVKSYLAIRGGEAIEPSATTKRGKPPEVEERDLPAEPPSEVIGN